MSTSIGNAHKVNELISISDFASRRGGGTEVSGSFTTKTIKITSQRGEEGTRHKDPNLVSVKRVTL